ncbi:glycine betaine ABC transporter substrate-binding protein [Trichococcus shcherbakoviae]|jgi:osmoprotectant transport system substrate-binding protein|uniref:Glycine/betaine ABC transporter substrate-binding protein n=1 Tax=Trichococcus shcherbakoviae subsp. psychrophilus TaxID=2585775 RepID=A0A5C5E997_9LACT|nr:glycine betaine ABC transporter substrate-binding protein [Trichococcus shcherbakoviae]TNV69524.1 glycine/betaine ABC transporter substrate-binding protein [Trichococcus shcherbakoviae subsp. psychrophilus]
MKRNNIISTIAMLAVALIVSGCSSLGGGSTEDTVIRVGSKDFTENLVVSEIYALALEDAGYEVERIPNIASSVVHTSITNDEIDLYPEYTGTGLLVILEMEMETDPQKVYDTIKAEYAEQFDLTWLDYAEANDSAGLVIKTSVAEKYGIETISDLQKNASELRFASQGEFDLREDGIPGLTKAYGEFNWKSSTVYDNSLKYEVLKNDEADVAPAYTTEGQLTNKEEFTVLVDDKNFWPPYNLAPVIRNEVLEENPEIAEILNNISSTLDTETVTGLNAKVDVDGQEYEAVAKEYFESIN